MEVAVSEFFKKQGKDDPTKNFGWDYILVEMTKLLTLGVCLEVKLRFIQVCLK